MTDRILTIHLQPDWRAGLRATARKAKAKTYQGEELAFETPGAFFGKLTERRWNLVHALQGQGVVSIRELGRRVGRDVKRVHEDVAILIELGLFERTETGIVCPFKRIHIDFELAAAAA
jgi:predicted transcriptional regulator